MEMNKRAYCLHHARFHRLTSKVKSKLSALGGVKLGDSELYLSHLGNLSLIYTDEWNLQVFLPSDFSTDDIDVLQKFLDSIKDQFVPGFFSVDWNLSREVNNNKDKFDDLVLRFDKWVSNSRKLLVV